MHAALNTDEQHAKTTSTNRLSEAGITADAVSDELTRRIQKVTSAIWQARETLLDPELPHAANKAARVLKSSTYGVDIVEEVATELEREFCERATKLAGSTGLSKVNASLQSPERSWRERGEVPFYAVNNPDFEAPEEADWFDYAPNLETWQARCAKEVAITVDAPQFIDTLAKAMDALDSEECRAACKTLLDSLFGVYRHDTLADRLASRLSSRGRNTSWKMSVYDADSSHSLHERLRAPVDALRFIANKADLGGAARLATVLAQAAAQIWNQDYKLSTLAGDCRGAGDVKLRFYKSHITISMPTQEVDGLCAYLLAEMAD